MRNTLPAHLRAMCFFGVPIAQHQAIQSKPADMATKIRAARLLTYDAASKKDRGERVGLESGMAKLFASESALENATECMRIHGAYGYSKEFPLEQKLRDAWGWGIAGGAIDIQKMNITSALIGRRFNQRN